MTIIRISQLRSIAHTEFRLTHDYRPVPMEHFRIAREWADKGLLAPVDAHHLRLIENMPMGSSARSMGYASAQPILNTLKHKHQLIPLDKTLGGGPARYWQTADGRCTIGLITPISQHFCDTCNRIRMAVDGTLYMCLGQEEKFELRPLLRAGCSDEELQNAIRQAIELKPEKHEFKEKPEKIVRFMSMTGG